MRGLTPEYDLVVPKDLKEALALLAKEECSPFAGETDLCINWVISGKN